MTTGPRGAGAVTTGPRTVRIGITGPIGCGKSQVVRWLAELGVAVVDADGIARMLRRFGAAVTAPDGTLDRAALGRLVFADPAALRDLERIVHPAVRPRIVEAVEAAEAAGAPAVAIEAIKLVEGGLAATCDQRQRLLARGTAPEDADQRMAAQAGLAERLRPAGTWMLDTSGTAAETRALVVAALAEALRTAR